MSEFKGTKTKDELYSEMLEMLNHVVKWYYSDDFNDILNIEEIEQLIKEATVL